VAAPPVYVIGQLSYDFGTEGKLESFMQSMGEAISPHDPAQLLDYLDNHPADAAEIIFTLAMDTTAVYSIRPSGGFAPHAYEALREVVRSQLNEGAERVSIAGRIVGRDRLINGQWVPRIDPVVRGIAAWSTQALVDSVFAHKEVKKSEDLKDAVANFLERVYDDFRNLGTEPHQRALNYAATNAYNVTKVFESALREHLELEKIVAERSPIIRPNSDCWDVKLIFFDPAKLLERARQLYTFTVNVAEVIPSMVGRVRSWSVR
jgi:cyanobactin maturation PatA/PatG family protease